RAVGSGVVVEDREQEGRADAVLEAVRDRPDRLSGLDAVPLIRRQRARVAVVEPVLERRAAEAAGAADRRAGAVAVEVDQADRRGGNLAFVEAQRDPLPGAA